MDFLREVEGCVPALRRYARALLRDSSPDAADDLVHDCVERALSRRRLRRPRGGGGLQAWLFTILHNLHANQQRREAARPPIVQLEGGAADDRLAGRPPDQGAGLAVRDIAEALAKLAPEQREALLLVVLEGMSYPEVARVQGVVVGTVMSRLSRGRDRLRALTEGGEGGPVLRRVK